MNSVARFIYALAFVVLSGVLFGCDKATEPRIEELASFRVSAPALVKAGEPFSVTITAVGSNGTAPFTEFSGDVILSVTGGIVSPDTVSVANGTSSIEVVFSGGSGLQTLTARGLGKTGAATFSTELMKSLPGAPGDPIEGAIPDFLFLPNPGDYSTDHPELSGMYVSFNTIMMTFELGTTVQEGNIILASLNAAITGGIKGVVGQARGILFLRLPTANHPELEDTLASLIARSSVRVAVQDMLVGVSAIPQANGGFPAGWTWESTPGGGNWGLERIRVPQMWNLNEAVRKKGWTAAVGVVDVGFFDSHIDLQYTTLSPGVIRAHGTHVAGIIGATFDNAHGIDGINPFARMTVLAPKFTGFPGPVFDQFASLGQLEISGLVKLLTDHPEVRVINVSLGYNWNSATPPIEPDLTPKARLLSYQQGEILADALRRLSLWQPLPIICVAAGNESSAAMNNDAVYSSPMANAGIAQGIQEIIVVENVQNSPGTGSGNATRAISSCINGHISAPGTAILSTSLGPAYYEELSGTSMASPHVAGVASYMLCVDPTLSTAEVRDILMANSLDVGGGARNRIDAWASVVDIDMVKSNDNVLRMMCDIDDGTPDGNQRVTYDGKKFLDNDADGDQGVGDGDIDMSDFRCWRDRFLLTQTAVDIDLDGDHDHFKKDVNKNGVVEDPAGESVFPRGDFNGDGMIDELSKRYVPGAVGREVTDLEVLQSVFSDPDRDSSELPGLLYSADYQIDARELLKTSAAIYARLMDMPSDVLAAEHTFAPGESIYVFTVPPHAVGYKVEVLADGHEYETGDRWFPLKIGGDAVFRPVGDIPLLPTATYLHTCEDPAARTTPINLAQWGIKSGDVILLDSEDDPDWSPPEMIAVFSSNATLLRGDLLHRVPGAIDAGVDFATLATGECGGEVTDIPEDFAVFWNGAILKVPAGATHLFVCANDSKYSDNGTASARFGVQISIVKIPEEQIH